MIVITNQLERNEIKLKRELKKLRNYMKNPEVTIISDIFCSVERNAENLLCKNLYEGRDVVADLLSTVYAVRAVHECNSIFTRRRKNQLVCWKIVEEKNKFRGAYLIVTGYIIDDDSKSPSRLFSSSEIMMIRKKVKGYIIYTKKHRYVCDYEDSLEGQRPW